MTSEMYNPAHPGLVLRDYLEGHNITQVAKHIGVSRVTLSKILNCRAGITAEMSLRLSAALGTNPSFWLDMQSSYDMFQARKRKRPRIRPLKMAA
ncbi:MAG TPA: HigA family addiction module antitoxin [Terracidiphilus sp.]|nr:HigA family addiction module antitoxin [Terracidiphilus sp.]